MRPFIYSQPQSRHPAQADATDDTRYDPGSAQGGIGECQRRREAVPGNSPVVNETTGGNKMGPQDELDFIDTQGIENSILPTANTTEINPVILDFLEECVGIYRYHTTQDTQVDIVLDIGQNEPILISLDDVKPDLVEFVKGLKPGEKVGIFRLDTPQQFFVRRVELKLLFQ